MNWVAKNSITGTTYGNTFKSVYECQEFIDKKLLVLEYQFQLAFGLEKEVIARLKEPSIYEMIQNAIKEFEEESGLKEEISVIVDKSLSTKNKKECQHAIDLEIKRLRNARWQRNNIIRCYEVQQERFADGFDF